MKNLETEPVFQRRPTPRGGAPGEEWNTENGLEGSSTVWDSSDGYDAGYYTLEQAYNIPRSTPSDGCNIDNTSNPPSMSMDCCFNNSAYVIRVFDSYGNPVMLVVNAKESSTTAL